MLLPCFEHIMGRQDSLEKIIMLGKSEEIKYGMALHLHKASEFEGPLRCKFLTTATFTH